MHMLLLLDGGTSILMQEDIYSSFEWANDILRQDIIPTFAGLFWGIFIPIIFHELFLFGTKESQLLLSY